MSFMERSCTHERLELASALRLAAAMGRPFACMSAAMSSAFRVNALRMSAMTGSLASRSLLGSTIWPL
jgi:hypothetical protein